MLATVAFLLPTLFWDGSADSADLLRKAGIQKLDVPPGREEAWRKLGFDASAFDRAGAAQATAPRVEYHMDVASATRVPWVDANGWQFERRPQNAYFYDAPAGAAALAAAEAFAYGVHAAIHAVPEDLPVLARMLNFLERIGQPALPVRANIGVIDDGSDAMGEVLNLMARHNLLFQVIPAVDPRYDVIVRPGEDISDPYQFAMQVRRRLTEQKRVVRIYGSNVVLVRLTGDGSRTRVHLLNYGGAAVQGLRVRVRGSFQHATLSAFAHPKADLQDYTSDDEATEFTVPELDTYAVIDLTTR